MEHILFLTGLALYVAFLYVGFGAVLGLIFHCGEDNAKRDMARFMAFWPIMLIIYSVKPLFNRKH